MMQELSRDEIDAFLDEQKVGRIGIRDGESIYVVPLVFGRRGDTLYVLTTDGRKTRAARTAPSVCFEVDDYDSSTGSWTSVIVWGRYEELHGMERDDAVAVVAERHGARRPSSSHGASPSPPTVVFQIRIERATGRWVERPAVADPSGDTGSRPRDSR
jgi:nitroimidazol reductase NimA-like FMN-containing flavoprotein (pyridoxamine 5'-phosphate oxidase superfamily)